MDAAPGAVPTYGGAITPCGVGYMINDSCKSVSRTSSRRERRNDEGTATHPAVPEPGLAPVEDLAPGVARVHGNADELLVLARGVACDARRERVVRELALRVMAIMLALRRL